jgi:Arc/MetJ family transcription regulator
VKIVHSIVRIAHERMRVVHARVNVTPDFGRIRTHHHVIPSEVEGSGWVVEVVQALRALRERIALPNGEAVAMRKRRSAHVDAKFVQAAISAVGVSSGVQQVLGRTDEDLRQEVDASARWTTVADEMRELLESLLTANAVRRQRIGLVALQTYQICQQLARDENNSRLHAYVGEMKRLNKFGRPRRRGATA